MKSETIAAGDAAYGKGPSRMPGQISSQISILVISRNEAYRSTLVAVLADRGMQAWAALLGLEDGTWQAGQTPDPQAVVIDGSSITDVPAARRTWPRARLICSLDYIDDWECARSLGADACVLKDRGLNAILDAVIQATNTPKATGKPEASGLDDVGAEIRPNPELGRKRNDTG